MLPGTAGCHLLELTEGFGRCLAVPAKQALATTLISETVSPKGENSIDPLNETIGLTMPLQRDQLLLSPRDVEAPTLLEAQAAGLLPSWDAPRSFTGALDSNWRSNAKGSGEP